MRPLSALTLSGRAHTTCTAGERYVCIQPDVRHDGRENWQLLPQRRWRVPPVLLVLHGQACVRLPCGVQHHNVLPNEHQPVPCVLQPVTRV